MSRARARASQESGRRAWPKIDNENFGELLNARRPVPSPPRNSLDNSPINMLISGSNFSAWAFISPRENKFLGARARVTRVRRPIVFAENYFARPCTNTYISRSYSQFKIVITEGTTRLAREEYERIDNRNFHDVVEYFQRRTAYCHLRNGDRPDFDSDYGAKLLAGV